MGFVVEDIFVLGHNTKLDVLTQRQEVFVL